MALLEETVGALRALFGGETWPGGSARAGAHRSVAALRVAAAVGRRDDRTPSSAVAARVADAWNGWGDDVAGFAAKAARLRELADGRAVVADMGRDRARRARTTRISSGCSPRARRRACRPTGVWTGTAAELRSFVDALGGAGATWFVVLPAGPADRLDVIAAALIGR